MTDIINFFTSLAFVYKQECRHRPSSKKLDGPQRLLPGLGAHWFPSLCFPVCARTRSQHVPLSKRVPSLGWTHPSAAP